MRFSATLSLLFIFLFTKVFSQEKIKHIVVSGESVYSIAKKYEVSEADIIELNPKAKGLLQLEMVLFIPKKTKGRAEIKKSTSNGNNYTVQNGESFYTISRKFKIGYETLTELNPEIIPENLQIGEVIRLPKGVKSDIKEEVKGIIKKNKQTPHTQKHTVISGESFYIIAKQYHISVAELIAANPQIEGNKLDVNDVVFIPGIPAAAEVLKDKKTKEIIKEAIVEKEATPKPLEINSDVLENIEHEVLSKETKYGISKRYGISIAELEKLNPQIANGLAVGQRLVIKIAALKDEVKSVNEVLATNDTRDTASNSNIEAAEIKEESLPLTADAAMKADFLIAKASENLGVRYRSGGTDRDGFDCSGLMFATFKNIDMNLPHSSADMAIHSGVKIDRNLAQKGDLIFFATQGRWVGHVGMITEISDEEIKFIHSSTSSGVIISSTKESYYAKRFVQINRVLN